MSLERSPIVRVWGKADSFDIEFSQSSSGKWTCKVPPDTKDGQYACELKAQNEAGKTAYYTGILFMCSGVCHVDLKPRCTEIREEKYHVKIGEKYRLPVEKGCCHVR